MHPAHLSASSGAAGMAAGALLIGLHMAATHGVTLGMMSSAIPATTVPGLGRISGTAWSFTDLVLGALLLLSAVASHLEWRQAVLCASPKCMASAVFHLITS